MPPTLESPRTRTTITATALLLLSACGGTSNSDAAGDPTITHVHGMGVNPADNTLYVATHLGVFTLGDGVKQIGPGQDTMGFTVTGPDTFLASGHPATTTGPANLGLIASTDQARTWKPVAFEGEADFHAIEKAGPWTYAYAADQGLIRSRDQTTWSKVADQQLLDIAVDPSDSGRVLASTVQGQLKVIKPDQEPSTVPDAPLIGPVDYADTGLVTGLGPVGQVYVSRNGGSTWTKQADLPGDSQALDANPGLWHAATSTGIYTSVDDGTTWTQVYTASP